MAICDMCGNDYDKAFQVTKDGKTSTFDSFECAIAALAPRCAHCDCRIIGHGMEANGTMFCCAHCASQSGVTQMKDRVSQAGLVLRQACPGTSPKVVTLTSGRLPSAAKGSSPGLRRSLATPQPPEPTSTLADDNVGVLHQIRTLEYASQNYPQSLSRRWEPFDGAAVDLALAFRTTKPPVEPSLKVVHPSSRATRL
jgi:hypothetical protein